MSYRTLLDAAVEIRARRLSPGELVEDCLRRIAAADEQYHAWTLVDAQSARKAAQRLTAELTAGHYRGTLHGIPVGIKDVIDVAGLVTAAGSPLRRDCRAAADAPVVAALRRAGAVILGKTVTVEFACFDPPPTRNPWNVEHTPGGSSSGSAAALALGMCLGALGTQTGGSLVRPASYCGVAACKPSYGRLSTMGVVPVSRRLDHVGPMARSAADLRALVQALLPEETPPSLPRPAPPRLGLCETFFLERADATIRQATSAALEKLRAAGAVIEPVPIDADFERLLEMQWRIMAFEAAEYQRADFLAHRASYGPKITRLLDFGLALSTPAYLEALAHQQDLQRVAPSWLGSCDALIMPATNSTAPASLETTGPRDLQAPWTYVGLPVVSFPCGLATDGLPAAVQLVGRPNSDFELLDTAVWCESQLDLPYFNPSYCVLRSQ